MKAISLMANPMVKELFKLKLVSILVLGLQGSSKVKANGEERMERLISVIGIPIKHMVLVNLNIPMMLGTKENSRISSNTEKAKNYTPMETIMREILLTTNQMAMAYINGMMVPSTWDTFNQE